MGIPVWAWMRRLASRGHAVAAKELDGICKGVKHTNKQKAPRAVMSEEAS